MRIIAGEHRGRRLESPPGEGTRPILDRVREALFGTLGERVVDARVLDLFAGTGALGLEALSRGARSCDFIENGTSALHALKANVAKVRARERTRIFIRDAIPFAEALGPLAYDIAFVDPPYGSKKLDRIVARWREVPFARVLVVEHAIDHDITLAGKRLRVEDSLMTIMEARVA